LTSVAKIAGRALFRHFDVLIKTLVPKVTSDSDALDAANAIIEVVDAEGLHFFLLDLVPMLKHDDVCRRLQRERRVCVGGSE
jgi:hypothetical protein